jgi:hypothetical protein
MIKYTTLVCPGAGAETSVYRLQLRLRPKVSAPAGSSSGSGSATLVTIPEASVVDRSYDFQTPDLTLFVRIIK